MILRRFICYNASSTVSSLAPSPKKKPLIFLGSPQVSVTVLEALFNASASPNSSFEVAGIVTQPPARRDRGRKVLPSPVAQYAMDKGLSSDLIFSPEKAGDGLSFLSVNLPRYLMGLQNRKQFPKDDSKATLAPKLTPDEAWLSFDEEAFVLHNKIEETFISFN